MVFLAAGYLGGGRHLGGGEIAVDGVVEESPDVVDEEGVEERGYVFFVGEFEGSLEGDPDGVLVGAMRGMMWTYQTPFRCIGPILTTCFCFSLLRIPSRRPRVIPATFRSLVPLIIWLSVVIRTVRSLS